MPSLAVIGLGNPGKEFENTRHNVGRDTLINLVSQYGGVWRKDKYLKALVSEIKLVRGSESRELITIMPETFMNDSGISVRKVYEKIAIPFSIPMLVVHDEMDLPVGTIRLKVGGSPNGHNGIISIIQHLKHNHFWRLRIGIAKPSTKHLGKNFVLERFRQDELDLIVKAFENAINAIEEVAFNGIDSAMNKFN